MDLIVYFNVRFGLTTLPLDGGVYKSTVVKPRPNALFNSVMTR